MSNAVRYTTWLLLTTFIFTLSVVTCSAQVHYDMGYHSQHVDTQAPSGYKFMKGVDSSSTGGILDRRANWSDNTMIPWEAFAYGEYIGPHRTPHVPEYRIRVGDQIRFVFRLTRELSLEPYRIQVGDVFNIFSLGNENEVGIDELANNELQVLPDGSISLKGIGRIQAALKTIEQLEKEINDRYNESLYTDANVVVQGVQVDQRLQDLLDAVDARGGIGGQGQTLRVSPDGTVQIPWVGPVPAVGLSLTEIGREVNMRYRLVVRGLEVTPILEEVSPRQAFVLGEVNQASQITMSGPTTAMQAIAQAGGWLQGANVRQIVVFRRDQNWQLMALRLDLGGALAGRDPLPVDDIWLRHGDIVLVPKAPIQRISELVNLYFTQTLYGVLPQQGVGTIFDADQFIGGFGTGVGGVGGGVGGTGGGVGGAVGGGVGGF